MTNDCPLHGDAWCSCKHEKEPTPEQIKIRAQKLIDAVEKIIKRNESKDGGSK